MASRFPRDIRAVHRVSAFPSFNVGAWSDLMPPRAIADIGTGKARTSSVPTSIIALRESIRDPCIAEPNRPRRLSFAPCSWPCSEPDPAHPGPEGDVKYYCRKSKPAENCMPPRSSGWLKVKLRPPSPALVWSRQARGGSIPGCSGVRLMSTRFALVRVNRGGRWRGRLLRVCLVGAV